MLSFRKFALERFSLYMDKKYGDAQKVPENKYVEDFDKWQKENFAELQREFKELLQKMTL